MAYQGFSPKLELAKAFARAKVSSAPISEAEKVRRKQLAQARADRRLEENLAQRALVESRRT
ncbi:hypothetical protein VG_p51 [Variovorax phage VarioGold]|uniref:hypothetical protein n=1 Tax=Variovorax sp. ZS18.2.2 TaxID=2971255 RepID=UPI0021507F8F|nr:hypothetical protein [Variovorax sp. ZS18.2.2]MCR6477538.1 hypothetical protein [Variovorax sp. ZS18.2.2]UYD72099.1 hypothetical protein VG_p51 [Variovorax phage VarioGold]